MRAEWLKLICGLMVAIVVASAYSSFFGPGEGNVNLEEFISGGSKTITFPIGGGSDNTTFFQLPVDANVVDTSMRLTAAPEGGISPTHVFIDVGEDGVLEYEFDEIGSPSMGYTKSFGTGVNNTPFNMAPAREETKYNLTQTVRLPRGVTIDSASIDLWAEEQDYLDDVIELNMPGGGYTGPWDDVHDYDPMIIVFNGKLIVIYRTHSDKISNGTDGDLVINYTTDGINWAPEFIEVSPVPDGTWPWDNSRDHWWGMDMRPSMIEYNSKLYVIWESNSTRAGPYPPVTVDPDDSRGITTGYDKDIMLTSSTDGINWNNAYVEITNPENEDGVNRGGYNTGNGNPQDWLAQPAVFNNRLYVLWVTNNTHSSPQAYGGSDLMVTWSDSPDNETVGWSNPIINLTADDMWNGSDFNPKLQVHDNKLFAIWQTNDTTRGNGSDYDLLMRYTSDGNTWSPTTYQISPKGKNDWTQEYLEGIEDREFWDMTPNTVVFNNSLGVVWETENYRYTNNRSWDQPVNDQTDSDIVVAWSQTGLDWDLNSGSNIFEVTRPENDWGDHYPHMITMDPDGTGPQAERLYATWNSNDQGVNIWDYDIMYTYSTDGKNFRPQRFGSMDPDHGGGDYWAHLASFKGWLYLSYWSFDDKDGDDSGKYADGDDADVLVRRIVPSYVPTPDVSIDFNNDGTKEYGPPTNPTLSSSVVTLNIKSALQSGVDSASIFHNDKYGNQYADIVINVSVPDVPCRVWLSNLDITYSKSGGDFYVDVTDFSKALNEYIRIHKNDPEAADGFVEIPVKISSASAGKLTMSDIDIEYNRLPKITVTSPGDSIAYAKESFTITWTADDPDDDATITLFYDTDNNIGGETEIDTSASPISEDNSLTLFVWDTSSIAIGSEFYVKAVIDDGIDSAYSYSKSKVKVTRDNVPPLITLLTPSAMGAKTEFDFMIEWIAVDEDSNAWISLYYDTNTNPNDGRTLIVDKLRENSPINQYQWLIGDEVSLGRYSIYAEISDEQNTTFDYSDGQLELVPPSLRSPTNLGIRNNIDTTDTKLETHDILPELTWSNSDLNPVPNATNQIEYAYLVNVGTSSDDRNDLLANWETKLSSVKLANNLSYGEDYYFEVKVTDGRGHFSSSASSSFFIVNHPPGAPGIHISPSAPATKNPLTVVIANESIDPDNDLVEYSYKWFKNDVEQTKYAGKKVVSNEDTRKGEVWKVVVTPHDLVGGIRRATGTSMTVFATIKNSAPDANIIAPNPNDRLQIIKGEGVTFIGEGLDPDDDDFDKLSFTWRAVHEATQESVSLGTEGQVQFSGLKEGFYLITLNVTDGGLYNTETIRVEIDIISDPSTDDTGPGGITNVQAAGIVSAIIAVIIIVIILMIVMRKRKSAVAPLYPELDQVPEMEPSGPSAEELYAADPIPLDNMPPPVVPPPQIPAGESMSPPQLSPAPEESEAPPGGAPAPEGDEQPDAEEPADETEEAPEDEEQ